MKSEESKPNLWEIIIWIAIISLLLSSLIFYILSLGEMKENYTEGRSGGMSVIQGNSLLPVCVPCYFEMRIKTYGIITAYNPVKEQCDNTPEITASGQKVREGIIANNCLEFGTIVKINDKYYEVQDRMNKKYNCNYYDILMFDLEEAKKFGRQKLEIELLK